MSAAAAVLQGRAAAESLMVDTCTVSRPSGTTLDPDSLAEVPTYTAVWSGPCRVQRGGGVQARETSPGGYEFGVGTIFVQLPISSRGAKRGDVVEVTAVAAISDPEMVGTKATVLEDLTKTHATKRTLACEEVS